MLLRLARRRPLSVAIGVLLVAPAVWLQSAGGRFASWYLDGLSLVMGATGVALLWVGLAGLGPDWIE